MGKSNDCTTGNLLDFENFSKHWKLIAIDLSKQIELEKSDLKQQVNFIGKFKADRTTTYFIIEKSEETTFEFLQNAATIVWGLATYKNGKTKNREFIRWCR